MENWTRAGVRIARTEWTRHRREFGLPVAGRPVVLVVSIAVAVGLGAVAHSLGRDLAEGEPIPLAAPGVVAAVAFGWVVWRSSRATHVTFERLDPDYLLTTVPARAAALGLLLFVYARAVATLAAPAVAVAAGLALGLRSPAVALSVVVATAALAALAVPLSVAGRLGAHFVGTRMVRGGFYRDLLVVFGWVPAVAAWWILQETSVSVAPLLAWLDSQPLAWFVDLALAGAPDRAGVSARRGLGALAVVSLAAPPLAGATTALARRIWETEPVGPSKTRGSRPLVGGGGWSERLLGDRVSRPVLTVARERWLAERRAPHGLLNSAYVLLFVGAVVLPTFGFAGLPLLLLVAYFLGLSVGVAFGTDPIGVEYRVFPMLLTTVGGRQFVRGHLLAALVAGVPVATAVVLPIGVVSGAGPVETAALVPTLVCFAVALCACTATVGVAVGLGADRDEFGPVPAFFTDVPAYAQRGSAPFLRLGTVFAVVTLASLPAFLGNLPPVYERAGEFGIPALGVRLGSILLATLVAVAVSRAASRIAARRYRQYRIR